MVKSLTNICVSVGLLLGLNACTQDTVTHTANSTDAAEPAQTLRIAAAANLSDVLPTIIESYQADKDVSEQDTLDIEVTYASSGKLYAQIQAGAPYDIFLSANQAFPARLAAEKVSDDTDDSSDINNTDSTRTLTEPFTYTKGQLALYSVTKPLVSLRPVIEKGTLGADDWITLVDSSKITIANPDLAPYGASAKAYLQAQGIYDTLDASKRLIQSENIGQAFQYAHTGSVDYGFVAQSQLVAIKAKPEQFITLPAASYPAILQDGIVINDTAPATAFTDYLRSKAGQQYFLQAGYLSVQ